MSFKKNNFEWAYDRDAAFSRPMALVSTPRKWRQCILSVMTYLAVASLIAGPSLGQAASINVTTGTLSLPIVEDFSTPQAVFDPFIVGSFAQIGESFSGQTVTITSGFEFVSGTSTGMIALQSAQSGGVITWNGVELQGLLSDTDLSAPNVGEGAISFFFTGDQLEFGLDLLKGDGGNITMQFFERSGALFDTVSFSFFGNQAYTFRSSDNVSRFAGVTITNMDSSGIAIDNLRLVPLPGAIWLLGSGLLVLLGGRRLERNASAYRKTSGSGLHS